MYTLMIVDDESLMRRGIKLLADLNGLEIGRVIEANNGEEALDICGEIIPDIVLLDINMPKMDGLTFAKHLREKSSTVKICMITGYDYFEYAVQALRAGVDEYILKPVTRKDIDEVLRKLIQQIKTESVNEEVNQIENEIDDFIEGESFEMHIKDVVESNIYNFDFSLSFLADELGFSTGYLSGIFKETFGLPFQDYVIKTRMERAKLLLLTTDMKNYEISDSIGIEDVNYFATRFKKTVGLTPKQYRNQVRKRNV